MSSLVINYQLKLSTIIKTVVCLYICLHIYLFLAFLVKETSGILIFGPSFRKPARKASSGEIKNPKNPSYKSLFFK